MTVHANKKYIWVPEVISEETIKPTITEKAYSTGSENSSEK